MAAIDLTTLAMVQASVSVNVSDVGLVSAMITALSRHIVTRTGRTALNAVAIITDRLDGSGSDKQFLSEFPVQSVTSVTVLGQTVPPSADGFTAGWVNDPYSIILQPGTTIGGIISAATYLQPMGRFPKGRRNVIVTYTAGYTTAGGPTPFPPGDPVYNGAPSDLGQAVTEFLAQQYKKRDWVDQASKTLTNTGENIRFRDWEFPPWIATVIQQYKRPWPV